MLSCAMLGQSSLAEIPFLPRLVTAWDVAGERGPFVGVFHVLAVLRLRLEGGIEYSRLYREIREAIISVARAIREVAYFQHGGTNRSEGEACRKLVGRPLVISPKVLHEMILPLKGLLLAIPGAPCLCALEIRVRVAKAEDMAVEAGAFCE